MDPTSIFTRKRKKIPVHSVRNGEPFSNNFNGQKSNPIKDYLQGPPRGLRLISCRNYDVTKAHF